MPITVKHSKVSTIPDDADTSLVRPSDWNADHTLVGLGTMAEQNANNVNITGGTIAGTTLTSPKINEILDANGNEVLGLLSTASATDYVGIKNGIGVGVPLHISSEGSSANIGLHIQPKGTGLVTISDGTDFNKGIRFRSSGSAASAVTLLDAVSTAGHVITLPDATTVLVGRGTTDTLTNKSISGSTNTLSNIGNSSLTNSAITINGTSTSLGGSISVGTVTSIIAGTGLSGGTITGSGTIAIDSTVATLSGTQTLTNKTLTSPTLTTATTSGKFTFGGAIDETVFAVSGTTPALSPSNGTIQTWALSGNSTPTAGTFDAGESMTLMIDDGTTYTVTWTSVSVTWVGGTAPTLATSGYTVIELWKVGSTIYGALVGTVA